LKKEPFDAILKGTKKQEFRDFTKYYADRLYDAEYEPIQFDSVLFRNGYNKEARSFEIEFISTEIGEYSFIINLGNIL
jgi:hypothetical protein